LSLQSSRAPARPAAGTRLSHLECARCARVHDAEQLHNRCECGGTLFARYDLAPLDFAAVAARPPGMWRYRELLPVRTDPVCLGEVQTPLLFAPGLSARWGAEVFVKDDGPLPGGTFKARGAAVGVSRATELGVRRVVLPSAGNAGGAWSLYAARARIEAIVTMARTAPRVNQTEVVIAGGRLELVAGTIADAGRRAEAIAVETGAFLSATFSEPYRVEGKKAAWLEVFDQLGDGREMRLPATIITPVGGGVAAVAATKAAAEVRALGWTSDDRPAIVGVQAAGCAPLVRAFESGADEVEPWTDVAPTAAAGLRVPAPSEGSLVLETIRATAGTMVAVSEDDIRAAVGTLATTEGIYACPEGAATVAAGDQLAKSGDLNGPVVLYNTGAGAKYAEFFSEKPQ
jgi:threonine synthase